MSFELRQGEGAPNRFSKHRQTGVTATGGSHRPAGAFAVAAGDRRIGAGADVNARADRGFTPLHRAAQSAEHSVVTRLLKGRVDPNSRTESGDAPLHSAVVFIANGEMLSASRLPWPEISRFDEDEMRDLMRQIVNKIYTFLAKMDDADFAAWWDFLQPQTEHWDKPRLDRTMMHFVEEYARVRQKKD